MRRLPLLLILGFVLAAAAGLKYYSGVYAPQAGARADTHPPRDRPDHEYTKDYSLQSIEKANTVLPGRLWIVGQSFLARVNKIEKLPAVPVQGRMVSAADNHEFLRFDIEFVHMFGCSGVGVTRGRGIDVSLAYRTGYDANPTPASQVEGTCGISKAEEIPVGWSAKGSCQFYYNKDWDPRYLVLTASDDKGTRPEAKFDVTD